MTFSSANMATSGAKNYNRHISDNVKINRELRTGLWLILTVSV